MEKPVLNDPAVYPSEEVILSSLGTGMPAYDSLFEYLRTKQPACVSSWKFYNDGKSWLLNVSFKKKTLFWLSVYTGYFRTAFYFTSKAESAIMESGLPASLKEQFGLSAGKKMRGLGWSISEESDLKVFHVLFELKLSIL